jgi:large subunit ribosomal protein L30
MTTLRITQTKSEVSSGRSQQATLRTLGLHGIRKQVERKDSPSVRGMIETVKHLVKVEEIE